MPKLSQQLLDAHMMGDQEAINDITNQINERAKQVQAKPTGGKFEIPTLLNDDHASSIKVYDFMNNSFGPDWWEYEIETIDRLLFIEYGVVLEDVNKDKLLAIRHVCRSDGCFADWYEFNQVALSFSGSIADFEFLKSPSPGMIINAVNTMNHIRPDRNGEFSNDVVKFICIALYNEGVYTPPPSLKDLISEQMKKMVSISSLWPEIYKAISKEYFEEDVVGIQAKRVVLAEGSAAAYNK